MNADRVCLLDSVNRHCVGDHVVCEVHVLVKEASELIASIKALTSSVLQGLLPNQLLFTQGAETLVLRSVEHFSILRENTIRIEVLSAIEVRLVVAPVMLSAISAVWNDFWLVWSDVSRRRASARNSEVTPNAFNLRLRFIGTVR